MAYFTCTGISDANGENGLADPGKWIIQAKFPDGASSYDGMLDHYTQVQKNIRCRSKNGSVYIHIAKEGGSLGAHNRSPSVHLRRARGADFYIIK